MFSHYTEASTSPYHKQIEQLDKQNTPQESLVQNENEKISQNLNQIKMEEILEEEQNVNLVKTEEILEEDKNSKSLHESLCAAANKGCQYTYDTVKAIGKFTYDHSNIAAAVAGVATYYILKLSGQVPQLSQILRNWTTSIAHKTTSMFSFSITKKILGGAALAAISWPMIKEGVCQVYRSFWTDMDDDQFLNWCVLVHMF